MLKILIKISQKSLMLIKRFTKSLIWIKIFLFLKEKSLIWWRFFFPYLFSQRFAQRFFFPYLFERDQVQVLGNKNAKPQMLSTGMKKVFQNSFAWQKTILFTLKALQSNFGQKKRIFKKMKLFSTRILSRFTFKSESLGR